MDLYGSGKLWLSALTLSLSIQKFKRASSPFGAPFWSLLASFWDPLGPLGTPLGPYLAPLGLIWSPIEALLSPPGYLLDSVGQVWPSFARFLVFLSVSDCNFASFVIKFCFLTYFWRDWRDALTC